MDLRECENSPVMIVLLPMMKLNSTNVIQGVYEYTYPQASNKPPYPKHASLSSSARDKPALRWLKFKQKFLRVKCLWNTKARLSKFA